MTCRVVGWYHSHPSFAALPSMIDIDNQRRQQIAHRTPAGAEPYVGAIVGPWDRRNGGATSQITWFCVRHRGEGLQSSGEPWCTLNALGEHEIQAYVLATGADAAEKPTWGEAPHDAEPDTT